MSLSKLWEMVKDREAWRATIHGVAKGQTWLSDWITTVFLIQVDFSLCFFFLHGHTYETYKLHLILLLLSFFFFYLVFCGGSHHVTCRFLVPWPGIELAPPALKGEVLPFEPQGKCHGSTFKFTMAKGKKKGIWKCKTWTQTTCCIFLLQFNMVISKLFLFLMQFLSHILINTGGLPCPLRTWKWGIQDDTLKVKLKFNT